MSPRASLLIVLIGLLATSANARRFAGRGIATWYSREDNDSNVGSHDNRLIPFRSVAVSAASGHSIKVGDRLYIPQLRGLPLGGGKVHDGLVRVDDTCAGGGCKFLDVYVGSNAQRDHYRHAMTHHAHADADQLPIQAYFAR